MFENLYANYQVEKENKANDKMNREIERNRRKK